jgi:hypothetical protein
MAAAGGDATGTIALLVEEHPRLRESSPEVSAGLANMKTDLHPSRRTVQAICPDSLDRQISSEFRTQKDPITEEDSPPENSATSAAPAATWPKTGRLCPVSGQ